MKERPILFSAPMVQAILDGSKTQTRRVVKPQPSSGDHFGFDDKQRLQVPAWYGLWLLACPYGQPGDRLWVRETWAAPDHGAQLGFDVLAFRATHSDSEIPGGRWRPSIHMPRWASRITLEVTGVRVERLQDISEADAMAEGVWRTVSGHYSYGDEYNPSYATACDAFRGLWESINGPGSWEANPWVWVVEFKRLEGGAK